MSIGIKKGSTLTGKNLHPLGANFSLLEYGKCPKLSNTLFDTFYNLNFAFYAVVS